MKLLKTKCRITIFSSSDPEEFPFQALPVVNPQTVKPSQNFLSGFISLFMFQVTMLQTVLKSAATGETRNLNWQ